MSDRVLLNQALLLHLWWPNSEVSLRPGYKGGYIYTLSEELRAFRGAGVILHQVTCEDHWEILQPLLYLVPVSSILWLSKANRIPA
jgi:hypothetical protein